MDVEKMLAELRRERESINDAILALERLASGRPRERGRPPKRASEVAKTDTARPSVSKDKRNTNTP